MNLLGILALGLFLGVRHATDADHVVAVSTIVTRERTTRSAMLVGALWGLGHTFTLVLVGGAIVAFGLVIPPLAGLLMEMSVAVMLVTLGLMNVWGGPRRRHGGHAHGHGHGHDRGRHEHERTGRGLAGARGGQAVERAPRGWLDRFRPLAIGVVHGLAGSAGLALLVLSTLHEAGAAVVYLLVFGLGTVIGMMLLTALVALPMAAAARRFDSFERSLALVTGCVSVAFGLFLAYDIGIVEGLFTGGLSLSSG